MRPSDVKVPASDASNPKASVDRVGGLETPEHQQAGRPGPPPIWASSNSSFANVEPINTMFHGQPHCNSLLQRQGSMKAAEVTTSRRQDSEGRRARVHEDAVHDRWRAKDRRRHEADRLYAQMLGRKEEIAPAKQLVQKNGATGSKSFNELRNACEARVSTGGAAQSRAARAT